MELVFTICLLLSDPGKYLAQYLKSGWREAKEEYEDAVKGPMNSQYPEWSESYKNGLDLFPTMCGLSDEEKKNITSIKYFPTPTQIVKQGRKLKNEYLEPLDNYTREFLVELNNGYYSSMVSKISHYSEYGVAWHAGPLIWKEYPKELQDMYKSQPIGISVFILLSILSEISIHFKLSNGQKLKELWTYTTSSVPLQKQLYEIKYQKLL
ncbi:hypothetical protein [Alicyclobacillus sp. ALC3]|uniref:hypothetical protein n=1 Tax=Alicyclobacillus sp. ALC3 TaxID=2796143 RepID=UPI002378915B|nr:hypothetical protein [Alicyclobacillus sp. ALC3]WDL98829.1 hypothetical protein JC200_09345 [Alicyclobacillus sp. ALC3]